MAREETTKLGLEEKGWREGGGRGRGRGVGVGKGGGRELEGVWGGGWGEDREVAESEV